MCSVSAVAAVLAGAGRSAASPLACLNGIDPSVADDAGDITAIRTVIDIAEWFPPLNSRATVPAITKEDHP